MEVEVGGEEEGEGEVGGGEGGGGGGGRRERSGWNRRGAWAVKGSCWRGRMRWPSKP